MSGRTWGLIVAGALLVLYGAFVVGLLLAGRRGDARAVAGFVPDCVVLFGRLTRDARLGRADRLLVLALVAYLASPIDLVPDVLPVVGQLDDAIVAALVLRRVVRATGRDALVEHWPGPPASLALSCAWPGSASSPPDAE